MDSLSRTPKKARPKAQIFSFGNIMYVRFENKRYNADDITDVYKVRVQHREE